MGIGKDETLVAKPAAILMVSPAGFDMESDAGRLVDIGKDEALGIKSATMFMVPTVLDREVENGRLEVEGGKEENPETL